MIAVGQLFWLHARTGRSGADPAKVRVVRALTVGAVTGLMLATAAFFLVNRLLPSPASWLGLDRAGLEVAAATKALWSVLGMDIVLLTGAIMAALTALRLDRQRLATASRGVAVRAARPAAQRTAPGTTQQ